MIPEISPWALVLPLAFAWLLSQIQCLMLMNLLKGWHDIYKMTFVQDEDEEKEKEIEYEPYSEEQLARMAKEGKQ